MASPLSKLSVSARQCWPRPAAPCRKWSTVFPPVLIPPQLSPGAVRCKPGSRIRLREAAMNSESVPLSAIRIGRRHRSAFFPLLTWPDIEPSKTVAVLTLTSSADGLMVRCELHSPSSVIRPRGPWSTRHGGRTIRLGLHLNRGRGGRPWAGSTVQEPRRQADRPPLFATAVRTRAPHNVARTRHQLAVCANGRDDRYAPAHRHESLVNFRPDHCR
jgi:hypothetical protein